MKEINVPVVFIEWEDCSGLEGWITHGDAIDFAAVSAIIPQTGFLLKKTKTHILLTSGFGVTSILNIYKIPRGMVRSMETLKVIKMDANKLGLIE